MAYYDEHEETGVGEPVSLLDETQPEASSAGTGGRTGNGSDDGERERSRLKRRSFRRGILAGVLLTIAVLLVGSAAGLYLLIRSSGISVTVSSAESGDAEEISFDTVLDTATLEKIDTLIQMLDYYYYEGISAEDLQEGLLEGLVEGVGDAYTVYYTAEEQANVTVDTTGTYSGIGAAITVDGDTDWPMISYTYEDSPAQEAGLLTGDLILQVDDVEVTSEMSTSDVAAMIRGEAGTSVRIVIQRDTEEIEVEIVRADIDTPSVTSQMLDERIGYIYIVQFSANTEEQFAEAFEELTLQGMEALVLDLRYNGGGTVSSCVEIMDDILPEGVTLTMESASGEVTVYSSDAENYIDIPIVLLVNGSTASASEIVTAALMDYDYATVIGTTTYGKGVYQQSWTLSDGSGIKITVGMFYSPDGNNYNGVGIEPDIVLEYENTAGEDADYSVDTDNQILKAIEVLYEELGEAG